ncbi:hypothetical protein CASFOL_024509 [Castilleja foliolosa]|uniref:Uncharacterized protein n=1 Tax=Castilleja foliolosa TaxID=1961234 RepID=A0ABD3CS29_9LAMI
MLSHNTNTDEARLASDSRKRKSQTKTTSIPNDEQELPESSRRKRTKRTRVATESSSQIRDSATISNLVYNDRLHLQDEDVIDTTTEMLPRLRKTSVRKRKSGTESNSIPEVNPDLPESSRTKRTRRTRAAIEASLRQGINATNTNIEYWDIGNADNSCTFCGAYFWLEERVLFP